MFEVKHRGCSSPTISPSTSPSTSPHPSPPGSPKSTPSSSPFSSPPSTPSSSSPFTCPFSSPLSFASSSFSAFHPSPISVPSPSSSSSPSPSSSHHPSPFALTFFSNSSSSSSSSLTFASSFVSSPSSSLSTLQSLSSLSDLEEPSSPLSPSSTPSPPTPPPIPSSPNPKPSRSFFKLKSKINHVMKRSSTSLKKLIYPSKSKALNKIKWTSLDDIPKAEKLFKRYDFTSNEIDELVFKMNECLLMYSPPTKLQILTCEWKNLNELTLANEWLQLYNFSDKEHLKLSENILVGFQYYLHKELTCYLISPLSTIAISYLTIPPCIRIHPHIGENEDGHGRILVLGAGYVGHSTIYKQLIHWCGRQLNLNEREEYKTIIYNNIILTIKELCEDIPDLLISEEVISSKHIIQDTKLETCLDQSLAGHIQKLWQEPAIQEAYYLRSEPYNREMANYWLSEIDRVSSLNYVPTFHDILCSRVRTTGIIETDIMLPIPGNFKFKIFDVGGERNERKKWIHCFPNVNLIIFVAALSECNEHLYEDEETDRMHESINLFDEIFNSNWFKNIPIVLYLNKFDVFKEKLLEAQKRKRKNPLSISFPEYSDDKTYDVDRGINFIRSKYIERARIKPERLFISITSAIDVDNMINTFQETFSHLGYAKLGIY